ncbi:hypothetical protein NJ76_20295, partial [Rhodococcus sp. IITR03]
MSSARFRPTRAGIINLWDYRDQEFSFADGRLVLRGPNGSGKTKALEVLFPFVLDGRIEPRRLNPFAGEERTMRSNLLYRGQDSAHSYVWMEFCRGRADDPEAVTVGIGMRATRGNDKVTRWHFVVDGRVGVDFSLLDDEDRPLTRKQLVDQIGADAIVDRPVDYRAAIDARMFGLGAQRYDQLINLILTLRRPQLAKNLDPKGLSQALTDGLRPLDDDLIVEAARSFSAIEEVERTLESLAAADDAAQQFVKVYSKYLRQQARTAVDKVATRLGWWTPRSGRCVRRPRPAPKPPPRAPPPRNSSWSPNATTNRHAPPSRHCTARAPTRQTAARRPRVGGEEPRAHHRRAGRAGEPRPDRRGRPAPRPRQCRDALETA